MPRGSGNSRSVENAAIRLSAEHKEYHAVEQTIAYTRLFFNGEERMKLIDLLYWKRKYKRIEDCADEIHVSYRTAQNYHRDFVFMVGYHLTKD